ncbi:UDP-N-acetylmuramoyl-L-alanyl-D-glutamate--2,6-diaminopimelate ligase [Buchnera aphidicola (Hormaphis cornu)]|nr:UDP-N-acetylmuramoyl-L-alanyl-D-glutamate--2,6-diaminopimelate ligase [Buchnera aphidicola (Hormaphis cornu)]
MKNSHNLKYLLSPWINYIPDIFFKKMTMNSHKVNNGDLFIAINGNKFHGTQFISHAISRGAQAVLVETNKKNNHGYFKILKKVYIIYFLKLSQFISAIASRFFKHPGKKMVLIGVTGTNGKTTVTYLIAQWINFLGGKSGIIGTLGNGIYNSLVQTNNTTDSAIKIQKLLDYFLTKKIKLVAIEVSSHAIQQNRVKDVPFTIGILTNISQDHLDYHGNMNKYTSVKWNFFSKNNINRKIFNFNDLVKWKKLKKITYTKDVLISIKMNDSYLYSKYWLNATQIIYHKDGFNISFNSYWGSGIIYSHLLGNFNVKNLLLAFSCLLSLGFSKNDLLSTSKQLKSAYGRMQKIKKTGFPTIIIDYAHTPDALKNVLKTLKYCYKTKIWCVFGCGGERDQSKRKKMGTIAEKLANEVIITNDNPRNENPLVIIQDILKNCKRKITVIMEREEAIRYAISSANKSDIILIAGKGHENYQIIGNKYINYSDQNTVFHILGISS